METAEALAIAVKYMEKDNTSLQARVKKLEASADRLKNEVESLLDQNRQLWLQVQEARVDKHEAELAKKESEKEAYYLRKMLEAIPTNTKTEEN